MNWGNEKIDTCTAANNYNQKCIPSENYNNNNHLWVICAFLALDLALDLTPPPLSFSPSAANSEWRGNQAALHPRVQRKGRRRNLAAEGAGEWKRLPLIEEVVRFFSLFFFPCLVDRIITLWFCENGIPIILVWILLTSHQILQLWRVGKNCRMSLAKHRLIYHFLLTRSVKEIERVRDGIIDAKEKKE